MSFNFFFGNTPFGAGPNNNFPVDANGLAENFFSQNFGMPQGQFTESQQQNERRGAPPASKNAIKSISKVAVTGDDLLEETNKECLICLDPQVIGETASKLPCGHLYHVKCLEEWLEVHCTCPVCRYELETDDIQYENDRKRRMRKRRQRYRRDELDKKSVAWLRQIMQELSINITGCIDKKDMVDRLVSSGKIEVIEGIPTVEMIRKDLYGMGVGDLRTLLKSYGLSTEGCLEKRELIQRLLDSGRVAIKDGDLDAKECDSPYDEYCNSSSSSSSGSYTTSTRAEEKKETSNQLPDIKHAYSYPSTSSTINNAFQGTSSSSNSSSSNIHSTSNTLGNRGTWKSTPRDEKQQPPTTTASSSSSGSSPSPSSSPHVEKFEISEHSLNTMPIRELKFIMTAMNMSYNGCVERNDIIQRFRQSDKVIIINGSK